MPLRAFPFLLVSFPYMLFQFYLTLTAARRLTNVTAHRTRIRLRALAAYRQPAHMAQPAARVKLLQHLYVLLYDQAEVSLDLEILFDEFLYKTDFLLGQVFRALIGVDFRGFQNSL